MRLFGPVRLFGTSEYIRTYITCVISFSVKYCPPAVDFKTNLMTDLKFQMTHRKKRGKQKPVLLSHIDLEGV